MQKMQNNKRRSKNFHKKSGNSNRWDSEDGTRTPKETSRGTPYLIKSDPVSCKQFLEKYLRAVTTVNNDTSASSKDKERVSLVNCVETVVWSSLANCSAVQGKLINIFDPEEYEIQLREAILEEIKLRANTLERGDPTSTNMKTFTDEATKKLKKIQFANCDEKTVESAQMEIVARLFVIAEEAGALAHCLLHEEGRKTFFEYFLNSFSDKQMLNNINETLAAMTEQAWLEKIKFYLLSVTRMGLLEKDPKPIELPPNELETLSKEMLSAFEKKTFEYRPKSVKKLMAELDNHITHVTDVVNDNKVVDNNTCNRC
jgi:hypothetical protein